MKSIKLIALLILCIALITTGCSSNEAVYTNIVDDDPVNVSVNGTVDLIDGEEIRILAKDDGNYYTPIIDSVTHSFVVIDNEHYEIHEGDTFTLLEVVDLGNGAVRDYLIVTPDTTKWAHLVWEIEHELETSIQFYKDTISTDNGTTIPSFNRNGNSTANATTLVFHTPTVTDNGTLMGTIQQGDGKKAGGSDREANEFILKQNCSYLIKITNTTVNNNLIFLKLNWYEHTNK